MFDDFGCKVGDKLYVSSIEKNKVCEFIPDCLKVFTSDYTAHGYVYGLYGKWGTPMEFSLKNLNKRVIFTKKNDAEQWLINRLY
jgi:hypothetical protein